MNILSEILRDLMARHGLTGAKLAEEIGLSATSVSQILTGKTKPRQVTLSRMMKRLCENSEDKQALLSAYETIRSAKMPASPILEDAENAATEEARVRRYLQVKSQSIAFREKVAEVLRESGQLFQGPHQNKEIICDFYIAGPSSTAIECKANPNRDWDRTLTSVNLFRSELPCERVIVIVPDLKEIPAEIRKRAKSVSTEIVPIDKLASKL